MDHLWVARPDVGEPAHALSRESHQFLSVREGPTEYGPVLFRALLHVLPLERSPASRLGQHVQVFLQGGIQVDHYELVQHRIGPFGRPFYPKVGLESRRPHHHRVILRKILRVEVTVYVNHRPVILVVRVVPGYEVESQVWFLRRSSIRPAGTAIGTKEPPDVISAVPLGCEFQAGAVPVPIKIQRLLCG